MGIVDFLLGTILGPGGPDPESYRDFTATPTLCYRCGRRITKIYVLAGRTYGSKCFNVAFVEAQSRTFSSHSSTRDSIKKDSVEKVANDERKYACPECMRIMVLTEREHLMCDYSCPYCGSKGNRGEREFIVNHYDMSTYNDRKYGCPDCKKIIILTAGELKDKLYACPHCYSKGHIL